eukprot:COSAG01_NODE_6064_length_3869_cov_5.447417_2_plen_131_part_00
MLTLVVHYRDEPTLPATALLQKLLPYNTLAFATTLHFGRWGTPPQSALPSWPSQTDDVHAPKSPPGHTSAGLGTEATLHVTGTAVSRARIPRPYGCSMEHFQDVLRANFREFNASCDFASTNVTLAQLLR